MQSSSTLGMPALSHGDRVVRKDRAVRHIALTQPHALAVF